ncbi:30S ribosomal protein S6 [Candidatus Dependentiae bacterium]|nr:30S ribosomal protein S6 [Candidatus Dependentiae bacterium]MCC7415437.1 30S ribosomal protein S6 [Campylobacterota bacterium]
MLRYELLMLAVPEITQDETKGLETLVEKTIKNAQGSMISFDRWGKYRLSYPVKKHDYGIYFLVRFEMEKTQPLLADMASLFAISVNDLVMRHVVTRLDIDKPLAYDRPPSVEDTPTGDVDTFLRKNKMGGLIGGRREADRGQAAAATSEWSANEEEDDIDMSDSDEEAIS